MKKKRDAAQETHDAAKSNHDTAKINHDAEKEKLENRQMKKTAAEEALNRRSARTVALFKFLETDKTGAKPPETKTSVTDQVEESEKEKPVLVYTAASQKIIEINQLFLKFITELKKQEPYDALVAKEPKAFDTLETSANVATNSALDAASKLIGLAAIAEAAVRAEKQKLLSVKPENRAVMDASIAIMNSAANRAIEKLLSVEKVLRWSMTNAKEGLIDDAMKAKDRITNATKLLKGVVDAVNKFGS